MTSLTTRVDRLTGRTVPSAPPPCATCRGWAPQVFVRDHHPPRDEACSVCGRRVPIKLIRAYHVVDLDHSEAGNGDARPSGSRRP